MFARSFILLSVVSVLSTACGAPPEADEDAEQKLQPPPVTLVDNLDCYSYSNGISWTHNIFRYSDGSNFTSCEIADISKSITGVGLWRAGQGGTAEAYCSMVADWDTASRGWWAFKLNGMTSTATYNDSGSPKNGTVISMPCTKY